MKSGRLPAGTADIGPLPNPDKYVLAPNQSDTVNISSTSANAFNFYYIDDAPVFSGVENKTIFMGDTFNSLEGVTVTDDEDGTIATTKVTVTGEVNTQEAGDYTLTYSVTDSVGNVTKINREIKVLDPIIEDTSPDTDTDRPEGYVSVTFFPGEHGSLTGIRKYYVHPDANKTLANITLPQIIAKPEYKVATPNWSPNYNSSDVIKSDLTYTAQYKEKIVTTDPQDTDYVKVSFSNPTTEAHGTLSGTTEYWVLKDTEINLTTPTVTPEASWAFSGWNPPVNKVYTAETNHVAQYSYNGDNVVPQPGTGKPDVPANYVLVDFSAEANGTFAEGAITKYWVNPTANVTIPEPTINANEGYKFVGWDKALTGTFAVATTIQAQYKQEVLTTDPKDDDYVNIKFDLASQGILNKGQITEYWVLKNQEITITPPIFTVKDNWGFTEWNPAVQTMYVENKTHQAQYKYTGPDVVPETPDDVRPNVPENFVKVTFEAGPNGRITEGETVYYVNPGIEVTLPEPTTQADKGYHFDSWDTELTGTFIEGEKITAKFVEDEAVTITYQANTGGTVSPTSETAAPVTGVVYGSTATASPGYTFVNWTDADGNVVSTDATYVPAKVDGLNVARTYTANFKENENVTITYTAGEGGTVSPASETLAPATGIAQGSTATASSGYTFVNWTDADGNVVSTDATYIPAKVGEVNVAGTYTANFGKNVIFYDNNDTIPETAPEGYVRITFNQGDYGTLSYKENDGDMINAPAITYDVRETLTWTEARGNGLIVPTLAGDEIKLTEDSNYKFVGWDSVIPSGETTVTNQEFVAQYKRIVIVYGLNDTIPEPIPEGYVRVIFHANDMMNIKTGSFPYGKTEKVIDVLKGTENINLMVYKPINPTATQLTYSFSSWDKEIPTNWTANENMDFYAVYKDIVVTEEPTIDDPENPGETIQDPDYVTLEFLAGDGGTLSGTSKYWVLKGHAVSEDTDFVEPTATKAGSTFASWEPSFSADTILNENATHTATYSLKDIVVTEEPTIDDPENPGETIQDPDYVTLEFLAGDGGTLSGTSKYWVLKGHAVSEDTDFVEPTATKAGSTFASWEPSFSADTILNENATHTAQYTTNPTDAETYTPTAAEQTVKVGETPVAEKSIGNVAELPEGTTFAYKEPVDTTTAGDKLAVVVVTYPDNSSEEVAVKVTVEANSTQAETYTPQVTSETVEQGGSYDLTDNVTVPGYVEDPDHPGQPTFTDVTPEGAIDVNTPGTYTGKVEVTYPDGSTEVVDVPVTVTGKEEDPTQADTYDPVVVGETVEEGTPIDLTDNVTVPGYVEDPEHPGQPTFKDVTPEGAIDVNTPGNYTGKVEVTYPDGSTEIVNVPVTITKKPVEPTPIEPTPWIDPSKPVTPEEETGVHVGYIFGYPDGSVQPDGNMTRAEAAAMLARLKGYSLNNNEAPNFTDTPSGWYNSVINAVVANGLMQGYPDGSFRPNAPITRAEFAQMIKPIDKANNGDAPFADVQGHWAEPAIDQAYGNNRIDGYPDGTFKPNDNITRAEAAKVLNSLFERMVRDRGLIDVAKNIRDFNDLFASHWGYYEVVEASNTHTFVRVEKGGVEEIWREVLNLNR
nr:Rib/alpha-like domain-containing protein [Peptoniphilus sp. KCTC 25270]